jgi:hypothetical protein
MGVPNYLIIGDLRAGSTSLYHYLRQYPEVYMPDLKELRYFAYDAETPHDVRADSYPVKTFSEYLHHFEKCGDAKAIGGATPELVEKPGSS